MACVIRQKRAVTTPTMIMELETGELARGSPSGHAQDSEDTLLLHQSGSRSIYGVLLTSGLS